MFFWGGRGHPRYDRSVSGMKREVTVEFRLDNEKACFNVYFVLIKSGGLMDCLNYLPAFSAAFSTQSPKFLYPSCSIQSYVGYSSEK